jgi:hypothetical protein
VQVRGTARSGGRPALARGVQYVPLIMRGPVDHQHQKLQMQGTKTPVPTAARRCVECDALVEDGRTGSSLCTRCAEDAPSLPAHTD